MSIDDFKKQIEQELNQLKSEQSLENSEQSIEESKPELTDEVKTEESVSQSEDKITSEGQHTEEELKAMEMGWRPDHKGPNYVSAKEFIERGSFFKKIDLQNKEIKDLKEAMKELIDHNRRVEQAAYQKGLQEALQRRQEAVQLGDVDAFNKAEQDLQSIQKQQPKQETLQVQNQPSQAGVDFVTRNSSWFNNTTPENAEMTSLAVAYGEYLQRQHPNISEEDLLKDVEATIKSMPKFKHRFENPIKDKPPLVGKSTSSSVKTAPSSRLTENQQRMFNQASKIDPTLKIEDYIKQLEMTGRLKND